MDAQRINDRIYAGRGKAALRIGFTYRAYRPDSAGDPMVNYVKSIKAGFNAADNVYAKAGLFGKPVWYADLDGRVTRPGDYLVRANDETLTDIYFIAAQQSLLPIVAVDCPRKIFIERQPCSGSTVGVTAYSGQAARAAVLGTPQTPWPCPIFMGGRVQQSPGLPGGVREAAWTILLPPSVPVTIQAADLVTDDLKKRYAVESAELSDLGWRLMVTEVHA